MTRGEVEALLERVRAATGPDREIDRELWSAVVSHEVRWAPASVFDPQTVVEAIQYGQGALGNPVYTLDQFTSSLDAIVGLIVRELPEFTARLYIHPSAAYADLYRLGDLPHFPDGKVERRVTSPYFEAQQIDNRLPALALCEAFLRAKLSLTGANK